MAEAREPAPSEEHVTSRAADERGPAEFAVRAAGRALVANFFTKFVQVQVMTQVLAGATITGGVVTLDHSLGIGIQWAF